MGHGQVVGDQQQGAAEVVTEVTQGGHHLTGHSHIQAGGGFISDHQGWAQNNGQGDGQALAHAAAEFMGVGLEAFSTDAHLFQQLFCPLPPRW